MGIRSVSHIRIVGGRNSNPPEFVQNPATERAVSIPTLPTFVIADFPDNGREATLKFPPEIAKRLFRNIWNIVDRDPAHAGQKLPPGTDPYKNNTVWSSLLLHPELPRDEHTSYTVGISRAIVGDTAELTFSNIYRNRYGMDCDKQCTVRIQSWNPKKIFCSQFFDDSDPTQKELLAIRHFLKLLADPNTTWDFE